MNVWRWTKQDGRKKINKTRWTKQDEISRQYNIDKRRWASAKGQKVDGHY